MYKKKKIFILILFLFFRVSLKKNGSYKMSWRVSLSFVSSLSSLNASLCESMPIICQISEYKPR